MKHINKILDKSYFAEIERQNFIKQFIMEAFGEDIGPRPVSILAQSSHFRSKFIKRMSSQSSHENKPHSSPNLLYMTMPSMIDYKNILTWTFGSDRQTTTSNRRIEGIAAID